MNRFFCTTIFLIAFLNLNAQSSLEEILPVRERSAFIDKVLEYRIDSLLPELMDYL